MRDDFIPQPSPHLINSTRAHRFIDAYRKGLTGKGAAWAAKKYRGHRVLPESILREFDHAEKAEQGQKN